MVVRLRQPPFVNSRATVALLSMDVAVSSGFLLANSVGKISSCVTSGFSFIEQENVRLSQICCGRRKVLGADR